MDNSFLPAIQRSMARWIADWIIAVSTRGGHFSSLSQLKYVWDIILGIFKLIHNKEKNTVLDLVERSFI